MTGKERAFLVYFLFICLLFGGLVVWLASLLVCVWVFLIEKKYSQPSILAKISLFFQQVSGNLACTFTYVTAQVEWLLFRII